MKISLKGMQWRTFHGLGGATVLFLAMVELGRFLVRKRAAAAHDRILLSLVVASCCMVGGLFTTPTLQARRQQMGSRQYVFVRAGFWQLGFASLLLTSFCQEQPPSNVGLQVFGCFLWSSATLIALCSAVYELYNCTLFAAGFPIAVLTSNAILLGLPLATLYLGTERMRQYNEMYDLCNSLYAVSLMAAFVTAWDTFFLGLTTAGRMSYANLQVVSLCSWAGLFSAGASLLLGHLHDSWLVALGAYGAVMILYAASMPLERVLLHFKIANYPMRRP